MWSALEDAEALYRSYMSKEKILYEDSGRKIGRGSSGNVYTTRRMDDSGYTTETLALKSVKFKRREGEHVAFTTDMEALQEEIKIMQALRDHEHIIEIKDSFVGKIDGFIVMELMTTDVFRLMTLSLKDWTESLWIQYMLILVNQINSALLYMHENTYVHRDIKPENIGCKQGTRSPIFKLMDFGLARSIQSKPTKYTGTDFYAPREKGSLEVNKPMQLEDVGFDPWSFGVTLCELLPRNRPVIYEEAVEERDRLITTARAASGSIFQYLFNQDPTQRESGLHEIKKKGRFHGMITLSCFQIMTERAMRTTMWRRNSICPPPPLLPPMPPPPSGEEIKLHFACKT